MVLSTSRTGSWQPSGPAQTAAQPPSSCHKPVAPLSWQSPSSCSHLTPRICASQNILSKLACMLVVVLAVLPQIPPQNKATTCGPQTPPKTNHSTKLPSQVDNTPLFHMCVCVCVHIQAMHVTNHQTSLTRMYRTAACRHLHTTSIATKAYMACHLLLNTIPKLSFSPS
jgi:hypothetical protein